MVKFPFRQWETFDRIFEKKFKLKIERLVITVCGHNSFKGEIYDINTMN